MYSSTVYDNSVVHDVIVYYVTVDNDDDDNK
jgi:hypothetical protein